MAVVANGIGAAEAGGVKVNRVPAVIGSMLSFTAVP